MHTRISSRRTLPILAIAFGAAAALGSTSIATASQESSATLMKAEAANVVDHVGAIGAKAQDSSIAPMASRPSTSRYLAKTQGAASATGSARKTQPQLTVAVSTPDAEPVEVRLSPAAREEFANEEVLVSQEKLPASLHAFMTRAMALSSSKLAAAPEIMTSVDTRQYVGPGHLVYVKGVSSGSMERGSLWGVYRHGGPLVDPQSGVLLAHEAVQIAQAKIIEPGNPALVQIVQGTQEVGKGDRLIALTKTHALPQKSIPAPEGLRMSIIRVQNVLASSLLTQSGMDLRLHDKEGGALSVVILNKGSAAGVAPGQVLQMQSVQRKATGARRDQFKPWFVRETADPFSADEIESAPQDNGAAMVFLVYENVSYALVLESSRPVRTADVLTSAMNKSLN